jgi:hypothetical protein
MEQIVFLTPSYYGDFERFRLLRKSIRRFYQGTAPHYVIVPKKDYRLFRSLAENGDPNLIVDIEDKYVSRDFYPSWWYSTAIHFLPAWRLKQYAGRPGWVIQQVVKLNADLVAPNSIYIIVDSDLIFVRPFKSADLGITADQRCLFRRLPATESGRHRVFMENARKILRLSEASTEHHYVDWAAVIYSDWLAKLKEYIEKHHGRPWQRVLIDFETISEYCIYGVFVEEVLKVEPLRILEVPCYYGIWDKDAYHALFSEKRLEHCLEGKFALVIQSNLNIPASEYSKKISDHFDLDAHSL